MIGPRSIFGNLRAGVRLPDARELAVADGSVRGPDKGTEVVFSTIGATVAILSPYVEPKSDSRGSSWQAARSETLGPDPSDLGQLEARWHRAKRLRRLFFGQ